MSARQPATQSVTQSGKYDDGEEEYDLTKMRCLWFSKRTGLIVCAVVPLFLAVCQVTLMFVMIFAGSTSSQVTSLIGFLGGGPWGYLLELAAAGVGFGGALAAGRMQKKLLAVYIILLFMAAVCLVTAGYERAYFFTANNKAMIDQKLSETIKDKEIRDNAHGYANKGFNIARTFFIAKGGLSTALSASFTLILFPEFAAFLHGVFPAMFLVVTAGFVYTLAADSGLDWDPTIKSKTN